MLENNQPAAELHQNINNHSCGTGCGHDHDNQVTTYVRDSVKIGRNDPCMCGSNKKYKKCCGTNN